MPVWAQIVVGIAAVLTALTVIWAKAVRPAARLITQSEKTVPVLVKITEVFGKDGAAFDVLHEMQKEFRTNGGSTLRDVVERIQAEIIKNHLAIEDLRGAQHLSVEMEKQNRERIEMATAKLALLMEKSNEIMQQNKDMVTANAKVAADLVSTQERADLIEGQPGEAADAASKSPPNE